MPKVSVIVPAYNAESFIEQCLQSLVRQTLKDLEIVIVNDGSTDNTAAIICKYERQYPNIVVINQENQGLYGARKTGLLNAKGDYVGWVDADDFADPQMFEKLYNCAVLNDSELAYCDYSFFPKEIKTKAKWFRPYEGKVDTTFVERNSQPWNKIVKRELLQRLEIADLFITCFDEAYIKVLLSAKNPTAIVEPLYFYRVGSGTMSSSYKNVEHYKRFVDASTNLKNEMKSDDNYWNEYFEYREIYYMILTMLVAANAEAKSDYLYYREKLRAYPYSHKRNIHLQPILNKNYGMIKAFVLINIIPHKYFVSKMLCKVINL